MGTSHGAYKFSRKPDGAVLATPGTRRIYSNAGYEVLADVMAGAVTAGDRC